MISYYVRSQEGNYEDSFPALKGLIIGKGQDKINEQLHQKEYRMLWSQRLQPGTQGILQARDDK